MYTVINLKKKGDSNAKTCMSFVWEDNSIVSVWSEDVKFQEKGLKVLKERNRTIEDMKKSLTDANHFFSTLYDNEIKEFSSKEDAKKENPQLEKVL